MNILILTVGDFDVASTRYRLGQFKSGMAEQGVSLTFLRADQFCEWITLSNYDLVILQKRLMRVSWVRRLRANCRRLIYDVDDAIWEPHGKPHSWWTRVRTNYRLRATASAADACTAPNKVLADHLRPYAKRVDWIPMALDGQTWFPSETRRPGPLRVGWAGAPPNLSYLKELSQVLHEIQNLRPTVEVIIYCGNPPEWTHPVRSTYHPYSPGTEPAVVRSFDIGLLPLPSDAFAAGKSPIKAIQYAACAVPCIASPVGATCELVENGVTGITPASLNEWRDALLHLIDDEVLRRKMGSAARERFLRFHSKETCQTLMMECWRQVIST